MIRNYFITAFRNIQKNIGYFFINLFGLSLGIISCLVIFLIVKNELGYDNFHKKADRIYRVGLRGVTDYNSSVSMAVAQALKNDFPEFEEVCQIWQMEAGLVKIGARRFDEKLYIFVDESFSKVFDYEWVAGDPGKALVEPNSIVLTESTAKKYFPDKDPIGQIILLDKKYNLKVTGLLKDIPGNTHLSFNFLVSFSTLKNELGENLTNFYNINGAATYVVLPKNYSLNKIETQLPAFVKKNWGSEIAKESFLVLQPLKEIHFDQRYGSTPMHPTTSKNIYWTMSVVAVLIILMACINFINLSTVLAIKRAKEVGIRKVLGSNRRQLILQFISETGLLVMLALSLALITSHWIIPAVAQWLDIKINTSQLFEPAIITWISIILLFIILLAGLYPAFIQSGFTPINSLKNKVDSSYAGLRLRKVLVFTQFVISQILIAATLIVAHQMDFLQNQEMGYNKEAVVSFEIPDNTKNEILKQQLINNSDIKEISFSSGPPSYGLFYTPFHSVKHSLPNDEVSEIKYVDDKFMDMFELKLLAGNPINRSKEIFKAKDTVNPIIVNEEFISRLGIKDPQKAIGERVTIYWNIKSTIIGVVKNFQSETKHKNMRPCILTYFPHQFNMMSARINPKAIHQTIELIDKKWAELFPEDFFKYEFLDDHIAATYRQEEKEYTAFKLFSIIAILIGCLGLYGLVAFSAVQRTKEIGIRKVLGANIPQIVKLLSKDFLLMAIISSLVAFPVAWYFMNKWLQNFAYHITINWEIFLLAGLTSVVIALLTIGQQATKAAIANPIKSLRTE